MSISDRYFANCARSAIGEKIVGRYTRLCDWVNPMATKWMAAHMAYFGDLSVAGRTWSVTRAGEEGELAAVRINRARTLCKAKQAMITASRVAWGARSSRASVGSDGATVLAKQILESAWKRDGLEVLDQRWEELAQVYSTGWVFAEWDRTRGQDTQPDVSGQKVVKSGDIRLHLLPPWYVKADPYRTSAESQDWWFVRLEKPKADLVEVYTAGMDEKAAYELGCKIWDVSDPWLREARAERPNLENDLAPEVHFIHRPRGTLSEGRHVVFCNAEVVLRDTPLFGPRGDYEENLPIVRRAADEYVDSSDGWTAFFDAIGPQEVLDALDTTQATTITTFGNPSLVAEKGTDFEPEDVAKGYRLIETQPGAASEPHFLKVPELAESHLKYREEVKADQRELLGLNEAALGQVGTTEKNAQADALAASMAVQQAGAAVMARRTSLSQLGNVYLTTLRHNVTTERVLYLVGKGEKNLLEDTRTWTGHDLGDLGSVEVEEVSALEQTQQGRMALVKNYMELGLIKTPQDMEEVRSTGRLEGAINPIRDQELLWKAQNEQLANGQVPPVHPVEDQVGGYQKNAAVLYSIAAMNNPQVQGAVQQTLDVRYTHYFGVAPKMDPMMLDRRRFMLGQGPLPQPMAPPPPGQSGTAPPAPGEASATPPPMQGLPEGAPPIEAPTSPLTGAPVEAGTPALQ